MRFAPLALRHLGSLKVRVTMAGVAALVLGIGSSVAVLLQKAERDIVAKSRNDAVTETVRAAAHLQRRLTEQQVALRLVATGMTPEILADEKRLRRFLDANALLRQTVSSVFVVNSLGELTMFADADSVHPAMLSIADRPYFRQTVARGASVVSDPTQTRVSGDLTIFLTQPLSANGRPFGVLVAGLKLRDQRLLAGIADAVESDDAILAVVTNSDGKVLAHPDPRRIGTSITEEPRLASAFHAWRDAGSPIESSGLQLKTDDRVVGAAAVPGPEWMVWRSRELEDVLAPLAAGRREAVRWALGAVVVSAGLLSISLWWLLQPLSRLERRAAHLFDGSIGIDEGWTDAPGEIGQLQRVFRQAVVDRAQMEALNSVVLAQLRSVLAAAPVGIALTRGDRFEFISEELSRLLGRDQRDLLGRSLEALFLSAASADDLHRDLNDAFANGRPYSGEWELLHANGEAFWARINARPVDLGDLSAGTIWTVSNVSSEVKSRHALEWSASHDALTGLGNRVAFQARVNAIFATGTRAAPASLLLLDLDRFKEINDTHGHAAGDVVLEKVAQATLDSVRAGDLVTRLGGDEFAIVLERSAPEASERVANAVMVAINDLSLPWRGETLRVGVSIGVAMLSGEFRSPAEWVAAADQACYAAKAAGRNVVRVAPDA